MGDALFLDVVFDMQHTNVQWDVVVTIFGQAKKSRVRTDESEN